MWHGQPLPILRLLAVASPPLRSSVASALPKQGHFYQVHYKLPPRRQGQRPSISLGKGHIL